jgi:outer membrane protein assembly factor BamA
VLDYDFNNDRVRYGLKWNDTNFRSRLENFSVDVTRDNFSNTSAAVQWSTRWIGWKQIGSFVRASYFRREGVSSRVLISEQSRIRFAMSAPLRDSRIQVSQLLAGLGFANNLLSQQITESEIRFDDELLISPNVGYLFDRRDSPLRPQWGDYFFLNVTANRVVNGVDRNYYILTNELRFFRPLNEYTVLGAQSRLDYQFGEYPGYVRFNVGGASSIRGYEPSDFRGAHRMFQSLELRISPWAKRFYRVPIAGLSDFLLTMVVFVDGGIAWTHERQFTPRNYHSGYGWGLRLYSPLQNVIRFDLAYDRHGRIRPYITTGVRF